VTVGALHYATMTNAELVTRGVPAASITSQRERMTGHVRRVQDRFARSVGWWGGVATLVEIAEHVDVDPAAAREYAKFRGLKWRTRRRSYTPAQLAVRALATRGAARDVGPQIGLLPIEVVVYRAAITDVLVQNEIDLATLLAWPVPDLEREWARLDLRVQAPLRESVDLRAPGYLDRVVEEAERRARTEEP